MSETETVDVEAIEVDETGEAVVSSEVAVIRHERETLPAPASVLPSPVEWEATMTMARTIAATQFVPESYRGKPEAVVAAILTGREMGIGPMESLRQIHMIDGRPSFAADLMMSKMRSGGVTVIESEVTAERAMIHARRRDTGEEATVEWTIADAVAAGLAGKKNWKTYPADMLWARVVGRLARRLGSDLLGGLVYATEEMQDWDEGGYGGEGYSTKVKETPVGMLDDWRNPAFDPGKSLAKDAPAGWEEIQRLILDIDSELAEWVSQSVVALYGSAVKDLADEQAKSEAGRRIANALARVRDELYGEGDFPPATDDEYRRVFSWAFGGLAVEGPKREGIHEGTGAALPRSDAAPQDSPTLIPDEALHEALDAIERDNQ